MVYLYQSPLTGAWGEVNAVSEQEAAAALSLLGESPTKLIPFDDELIADYWATEPEPCEFIDCRDCPDASCPDRMDR